MQKPKEIYAMVSTMIKLRLGNATSHPPFLQSSKLTMTLVENYVPKEKVVKSVTREIVLDLRPQNIKKVFHLSWEDHYLHISFEGAYRWYRENEVEHKWVV